MMMFSGIMVHRESISINFVGFRLPAKKNCPRPSNGKRWRTHRKALLILTHLLRQRVQANATHDPVWGQYTTKVCVSGACSQKTRNILVGISGI
jgi:hypothetical protein